ncbi:MAG: hypothetical protein WD602_03650 [Actinomycetota bacterium]
MRRYPLVVLLAVAGVITPATAAHAQLLGSLSINAPPSAELGSAPTGSPTLSGSLGPVQVTDTRSVALSWSATVSSTSFTGPGPTAIPGGSVTYISGAATESSGLVTPVPGPALGVTLEGPKTAFSGTVLVVGGNSVTWNPTIRVALPEGALAGSYSGTITHSVS